MAYFTSFLVCHLYSRHRFSSCGIPVLDYLFRLVVYGALFAWAGMVAYSRYVIHFFHNTKLNISTDIILDTTTLTKYSGDWVLVLF